MTFDAAELRQANISPLTTELLTVARYSRGAAEPVPPRVRQMRGTTSRRLCWLRV